jgi:hypothetical protein
MPAKPEYLKFIEVESRSIKTKTWEVRSFHSNIKLGEIQWWPAWRQYVLFPENQTLWNHSCLSEIAEFMQRKMIEHRAAKRREANV